MSHSLQRGTLAVVLILAPNLVSAVSGCRMPLDVGENLDARVGADGGVSLDAGLSLDARLALDSRVVSDAGVRADGAVVCAARVGGICVPRSFEVVRLDAPPEIRWVHLRDVLGSGLLDLVATSQLGNSVVVVRSRRDRALETTQIVETGRVGPGLAFGDVDRDGAMDFAVSVQGGSVGVSLAFFDGVAGGLFEAGPVIDQDQNPNWLALLDVNRDGRLDVAVRLAERGCVAFRPNTGPYTFGAAECVIPYSTSTEPEQLLSIDDDHDGRDELFELRYLPDRREIWRHQIGDGTVTASALVDAPLDLLTHNLAIRDVDRDGEVDLLAAELTDVWRVAVRTPMAGGVEGVVFPTIDFADELSIFQMSDLGDVDGDGVLDVVGFSDGGGRSRLYVLYGVP